MALLPCLSCNIRFLSASMPFTMKTAVGVKKQTNKQTRTFLGFWHCCCFWCLGATVQKTRLVQSICNGGWIYCSFVVCKGVIPHWSCQSGKTSNGTLFWTLCRTKKKTLFPSLFISTYTLVPAHSVTLRTIIMCVSGEIPTALSKVSKDQPPYRAESRWW